MSLRLDVGRSDDLAPFLRLVRDKLFEFDWREHERRAAQIGEARLGFAIAKRCVDLLIEPVDDLRRRLLGRTDAEQRSGLGAPKQTPAEIVDRLNKEIN